MTQTIVTVRSPKKEAMHLIIEPERCKGCGFCVEFCPKDTLALSTDQFNAKGYSFAQAQKPEGCIACGLCEMYCPDFAIYLQPSAEELVQSGAAQSNKNGESHG